MERPTIIRINEGTFIKTDAPIRHESFEVDSEFGGAKRQQKKAAKQVAKDTRKATHRAAVDTRKATHSADKSTRKATKKVAKKTGKFAARQVGVQHRVDKHALKFDQRMNRRTTRQELGQGGDTGMAASAAQSENSANYEEELPIDDDSQNLLNTDAQEQFQEPQMESDDSDEDGYDEEPEYEGDYEDESDDPESEYFSGFADEFDKAHYEATGARNNRNMRKSLPKKKRVKPTFVSKDKIKRTTCGYNKIDIAASNFGGGSGTAPNPLTQALITLALVGFTGFLVYKYAK